MKEDNKKAIGMKYNDWEVIGWQRGKKGIEWICRCKCGTEKVQKVDNIKNGRSKMCKKCYSESKKKTLEDKKPRIITINAYWGEYTGTYADYLDECKKRREINKKEAEEKRIKKQKEINEEKKKVIGKTYNRLTVTDVIIPPKGETIWKCICECGKEYINKGKYIKNGRIKSCGCIAKEIKEKAKKEICLSKKRYYKILIGMIDRCYNPKNTAYKYYGERGIEICDEWLNDHSKFCEWAIKNGYEDGLSIERIDVNGNYCPENCKWIPLSEQCKNKRRYGREPYKYIVDGKEKTLKEIQKEYKISPQLFSYRIKQGMNADEIIKLYKK